MKTYENIHQAYLETLKDIYYNPDFKSAPRGLPIREKTDYCFRVLNPTSEAIVTRDLERNQVIADYTKKEVELYNSCSNQVDDFAKASKFWEKIANPDGTINSAYGYLIWENKSHGNPSFEFHDRIQNGDPCYHTSAGMRTPWQWARESLIQDKDSRQAILRFSLPQHAWVGNKDQTCTLSGNFLIRDNQLHLSIVMRSNDMWLGLTYDLPWFMSLLDRMVDELRSTYPTLTKGTYTHIVHSLHIYERDETKILRALGHESGSGVPQ